MTLAHSGTHLAPGVWGVVATPFADDLSLDLTSLRRLVQHYQAIGVSGLTVLGVFGEAASLARAERAAVLETVAGSVDLPLVVGMTSLATAPLVEEVAAARYVVGDRMVAAMVQVNSPAPDVLRAHLDAVGGPVVVQDYPMVSGVTIPVESLVTCLEGRTDVAAVKAEAPPTPPAITRLASLGVPVFGGLGGVGLVDELACGSAGAMTGFSYPEGLLACVDAYREGGFDAAVEAFLPYLPLVNFEQQQRIAMSIRKECLRRRGLIAGAAVRPPAASLPASLTDQLGRHLDRIEAWRSASAEV